MIRQIAVILFLLSGPSIVGQKKPSPVAGPVLLIPQSDLIRGDVAAFPRVIAGPGVSNAVANRINDALHHNESARADALDCQQSSTKTHGKPDSDAWKRTIDITMRGPRFIAFLITDSYFCGAYPNFGIHTRLVYDLTNGLPVQWLKFLPANAAGYTNTAADGSIEWPVLVLLSKRQATAECREVFDQMKDVHYSVNLNARKGTLDAQPDSFPHVVQACAETVALNAAALRKLGVSPTLTTALDEAHALQEKSSATSSIPTKTDLSQQKSLGKKLARAAVLEPLPPKETLHHPLCVGSLYCRS